jgi:hypothetical protein
VAPHQRGIDTTLNCDCGSFQASLANVDHIKGTHLRCHCADCRAFVRVLLPDAVLKNGLHLFQTDPDKIEVTKGVEYLECLTLSPKGLLRWYASCCQTPMFNTPRSAKVPMVAILTDIAEDPSLFGPVVCDAFRKTTSGKSKTTGLPAVIVRFLKRAISSRLSGRWQETPFFIMPENIPLTKPYVVAKDKKRAAYKV